VQLLQQLSNLPATQQNTSKVAAALPAAALNSSSFSCDSGSAESPRAADSGHDCNPLFPASSSQQISPPDDVPWLWREIVRQPWPQNCPAAEDLIVPLLCEHFKTTAHNLSLYLVQYDAFEDAAEQAGPLRNLQEALLQHFHVIVEVCGCSDRTYLMRSLQLVRSKDIGDTGVIEAMI
jgi:hypothetical protein